MTPDEARRQFYQEQAEAFGAATARNMAAAASAVSIQFWSIEYFARLAGHFGRLALGQTVIVRPWEGYKSPEDLRRPNVCYTEPTLNDYGCDGSERCACEACSVERTLSRASHD